MVRVLVVEDEEAFVDALSVGLENESFEVEVARDGREALEKFDSFDPELILLDLMLPRVSGADVCRDIRSRSSVPIIMVSAKATKIDTVVGLELGADDYITKPYGMHELLARMRAVLRRTAVPPPIASGDEPTIELRTRPTPLIVGDVTIDAASYEVRVRGDVVSLPLKEFELLSYLMKHAGRVLTRDSLIDRVWGSDYVGDTKTLDVHIKRLRSKVEDEPSKPTRIVTIRGLGYKFQPTQDPGT